MRKVELIKVPLRGRCGKVVATLGWLCRLSLSESCNCLEQLGLDRSYPLLLLLACLPHLRKVRGKICEGA